NEADENYSTKLSGLENIFVDNKCDLLEDDSVIDEFEKKIGKKVVRVSAISNSGTKEMLSQIVDLLDTLPEAEPMEVVAFDENRNDSTSYIVTIDEDGVYEVHGGLINMLVRNVVLDDYESFRYFQKMLKDRGVIKELVKNGCKEGDTVRIADIEFEFVE
ncbi:MAG: Obg family GTPase CgtA, partial [Clostridia bacterium]|nr:Obg family GTPase CgtA [Clostridia bacterium]